MISPDEFLGNGVSKSDPEDSSCDKSQVLKVRIPVVLSAVVKGYEDEHLAEHDLVSQLREVGEIELENGLVFSMDGVITPCVSKQNE